MSRGPSNFREADLKRVLRAIGKEAETVEIEPGRIKISFKNGKCAADNKNDETKTNEWDEKYGQH